MIPWSVEGEVGIVARELNDVAGVVCDSNDVVVRPTRWCRYTMIPWPLGGEVRIVPRDSVGDFDVQMVPHDTEKNGDVRYKQWDIIFQIYDSASDPIRH